MADTIVVHQSAWWDEILKILAGFVLAVTLFILQDWWRAQRQHKRVLRYSLKEVEHNIDVLEKCVESTKRIRQEITEGNRTIYFDFQANNILYKFTLDAHALGLLFNKLSSEEIAKLYTNVFGFFSSIEFYVSTRINQYQAESITPQDIIDTMKWVGDKATDAIVVLKSIKTKLKKK